MLTFKSLLLFVFFIHIIYKTPKSDNLSLKTLGMMSQRFCGLTSRRTVNLFAFKVHRDEEELVNVCTDHAHGVTRVEKGNKEEEIMQQLL